MDDYRDAIASCCRQLRLSANLADNAFAIQGESHQEYLYNLLSEEIKCRKAARVGKLINSAGFPAQHNFASFHPDEVQFPSANSHFLRTAGPHFPDSQGHIKRTTWVISRAEGTPPH